MTEHGSQESPVEGEAAGVEEAEAPPPPPEPWTPRRVGEWNAYYDMYVAAFVLLLALLGALTRIQPINTGLWSLLQAGRQVVATAAPVVTDASSIAGEGRRWVNIPWLFEVLNYELYATAASTLTPTPDPGASPTAATARGEQRAAGALIALNALVRLVTAWLLLGLRRKGPGLWWAAICTALALGVTLSPSAVETFAAPAAAGGEAVRLVSPSIATSLGGIAGPATVAPDTWGLMFLAIELLLLHHAINLGKAGRLYGLIPLFLIWANVDESFSFGLVALAAAVIGLAFDARRNPARPGPRAGLIVLASCLAATFLNPSHAFGVLGAFGTIFRAFGLGFGPPTPTPVSAFGKAFATQVGPGFVRSYQVYYVALVGLGLLSFALNRRRFSAGRLLMFAAASALWALALSFSAPFAAVFVFVVALNGQEWYLDTFGTEGRLGAGWVFWSTGGRLVTIAVVFLAIFRATTGWGNQPGDPQFGLGYNPDDFPFEAADSLRDLPIAGNVLNTTVAQGDAIAWRAAGKRKAFVDSRIHLYPRDIFEELAALRIALRDDRVEKWQPVLDAYKVGAVMIQVSGGSRDDSPITYARLMASPNWVPFYDDGAIAMFGRADEKASPADLAYFQANRLDADALAYRRPRPVPPWERPPTATSEVIDRVFQNRLMGRPQPHGEAARRWMSPIGIAPGTRYLPDPAHCLLAVREARIALSIKPDDANAFGRLIEAYRLLLIQESALIAGIPLTPENIPRILQSPQQARVLANRTRQLITAMNFAIQTLPPAKDAGDRVERANLNYMLAQLFIQNGVLDLARDRLTAIDGRPGELGDDFFRDQARLLGELKQRLAQVETQMNDMVIQRRAAPQEKAAFARSAGALGTAVRELEEANDAGGNPAGIRPVLVDLYCDSGQPDKALDVIGSLNIGDPSLDTGPGTASYRQGKVYFLLGNYDNAITLWRDRSIDEIRKQRSVQATAAGQALLNGDPTTATRLLLELPEKVSTQAEWEFEMALAALEGGFPPKFAAEHFQAALKLEPNLTARPVIAYYLEKLGEAVPPPRAPAAKPAEAPTTPPTADPGPAPAPTPAPAPPAEATRPADPPANPFEAKPTGSAPTPKP